jgi:hypothetical protein
MHDLELLRTQAWVERVVLGLRLCPFARAPHAEGRIRYVVTRAPEVEALIERLVAELELLRSEPPERIETTLLIHPHVLGDFDAYNQFLDTADAVVAALGLEGVVQIASFHPDYRFAGSDVDEIANATNRSPYPTLHLLREDSIARALAGVSRPEAIFEANIATMQRLGAEGWAALQRECLADARRDPDA